MWVVVRVLLYTVTVLRSYQDSRGGVPISVYAGVTGVAAFAVCLAIGIVYDGYRIIKIVRFL